MYLEELREVLEERCGVYVSESTIWRTLQRVGFRMKEVSVLFAKVSSSADVRRSRSMPRSATSWPAPNTVFESERITHLNNSFL